MISSIAILIVSTALLLFYIQTLCEKILRREFSRAYFQDVIDSIDLEFPRLRQSLSTNAALRYSQIQLALRCDYVTLKYLVKKANPRQPHFSWQETLLLSYFRTLLLVLPIRYAFHLRERHAVMKLTVILHHFANLVGERVCSIDAQGMAPDHQA